VIVTLDLSSRPPPRRPRRLNTGDEKEMTDRRTEKMVVEPRQGVWTQKNVHIRCPAAAATTAAIAAIAAATTAATAAAAAAAATAAAATAAATAAAATATAAAATAASEIASAAATAAALALATKILAPTAAPDVVHVMMSQLLQPLHALAVPLASSLRPRTVPSPPQRWRLATVSAC
jgi:hypothetical protein